jgi:hypothetical protein
MTAVAFVAAVIIVIIIAVTGQSRRGEHCG